MYQQESRLNKKLGESGNSSRYFERISINVHALTLVCALSLETNIYTEQNTTRCS